MMALAAALCATLPPQTLAQQTDFSAYTRAKPVLLPGQSATLLPDGRWLLLGGEKDGAVLAVAAVLDPLLAPRLGQTGTLSNSLRHARAWHTATLLPDGSVLVFGGVGENGQVVGEAELFDPQTQVFEVLPDTGLMPRAHHTATVLTEGWVLVAGGLSGQGQPVPQAGLWNPWTRTAEPFKAELAPARYDHQAALLASEPVLLWGGRGSGGEAIEGAALYLPQDERFTPLDAQSAAALPGEPAAIPAVSTTLPGHDALEVPIDTVIAVRFSKPLSMASINASTVTLFGPTGPVAGKVVPAEEGLLVFVTPQVPLQPATRYTLFLSGAVDDAGTALPFTAVSFTTASLATGSGTGAAASGTATFSISPEKTDPDPAAASPDAEAWTPGPENLNGDWRSARPDSPLQGLSALQALPGVTALAGQLLTLDGKALANATLTLAGKSVRSDATGRFLLADIPAGRRVLVIDGASANKAGKTYGLFEVQVQVVAGKTNALGYTAWMPLLDTAHAVSIASPTTAEAVVTTPAIPGLELHIPKGTVIRDRAGNVVTQVSITAIPVDRPPFPLPTAYVPIYFTVQPGGAYLQGIDPASASGARLVYPNYQHAAPGSRIDFWSYDPEDKGWYVYGQGTVGADGAQVFPDPGVAIYEFTGAMVAPPGFAPAFGPPPAPDPCDQGGEPGNGRSPCGGAGGGGLSGAPATGGEPVDLATGLFVYHKTDLVLPDTLPIRLTRTYRPQDTLSRAFGIGTTHPYDIFFVGNVFPYTYIDLILPDGGRIHYIRTSAGTGYLDAVYQHTATPTRYFGSTISWRNVTGGGWDLKLADGTHYLFPPGDGATTASQAALTGVVDRYGNSLTLTRGSAGRLERIASPNGRWIAFTYDASNRITQAQDHIGRTVGYTYDASGRLWKVTDAAGGLTQYTYDGSHRMLTVTDPRGIVYLTNNTFDAAGRVTKQTLADGGTYQFAYTVVSGSVTQTDVTDPRGTVRRVAFNAAGYPMSDTRALGKLEQQTYTYERDASSNLLLSVTDALGRKSAYTYDAMGNVASATRLSGTANAVTTAYTYEPTYNQVASATDPLSRTTGFAYDSLGSLTTLTDPLNQQTRFAYNAAGQVTSVTDPLGHTRALGYDGGDLVSVTDALGNTSTRFTDAVGRVVSVTDPLGNLARTDYDALNRVTQVTDPLGGVTRFAYDANGNLLSVTDPRGGVTSYTYDAKDRPATRTDPLGKKDTYAYDLADNLASVTDRKGQLTRFTYDALNRRTFAGFGAKAKGQGFTYVSTVNATFDAGNRLTQAVDSQSGTISRGYDGLDRLTSETTPQGSVSYTYDAAGRRTGMTVAGQAPVAYGYDEANRLTGITQGTASVALAYDAANRRATLTLPNGVTLTYGYDNADRLTSITYQSGATPLGDLAYTYDAAGRRVSVGGSLAQTGLPAAVATTTYNAANRLTAWGSATLTYDANGNLLSDGANSYTWDARNRLASMSGASFQYDPFGRRTAKTVAGVTTNFLYDGANPVQELSGATPTANLLTGLGIDEIFTRTDAAGARSFLPDALGSTLALTDGSGAVQTSYTYEPYGKTSQSGAASGNAFQYTGRENDGTGLYYYRARYYHPVLQRFIAEDPIGLAGGPNLYSYVRGNPVGYNDPAGLNPYAGALAGAEVGSAFGPAGTAIGAVVGLVGGYVIADQLSNLIFAKPPENAYDPNGPKAPGKPGKDEGFCEPKGGDDWVKNPNGRGSGWRDANGDVWVPTGPRPGDAHGGPHWDVQTPGGGYVNVYPGGNRR